MYNAIGMIEYCSIAKGITAVDDMVKTAEVELVKASPVCPGKYIVLMRGKLSAINEVIQRGKENYKQYVMDTFILGNPHKSIFSAIKNEYSIGEVEAMGVLETYSVPSILTASDTAAKTAQVQLVAVKMANMLGGKAYAIYTGELAAVEAATRAAEKLVISKNKKIETSVIPNPDPKVWDTIL